MAHREKTENMQGEHKYSEIKIGKASTSKPLASECDHPSLEFLSLPPDTKDQQDVVQRSRQSQEDVETGSKIKESHWAQRGCC